MDSADKALMASVGNGYLPGRNLMGVDSRTKGCSIFQLLGNGVKGSSERRKRDVCSKPAATRGASKRAKSAPSSGQSLYSQPRFKYSSEKVYDTYRYSRPSVPHTHPLAPIITCSSPIPKGEVFRKSSLVALDPFAKVCECDARVALSRTEVEWMPGPLPGEFGR